jgi:hypothetical protein
VVSYFLRYFSSISTEQISPIPPDLSPVSIGEAEDIPASHGGSPEFEDALRLRAGSLGIKEGCEGVEAGRERLFATMGGFQADQ